MSTILSSESLISPLKANLFEILNQDLIQSPLVSNKDFRLEFLKLYQNKEFFDFEIKIDGKEEPIRCHKLFLIINGFNAVKECVGHCLTIEDIEDKDLVQSLIHFFYTQKIDLKIDGKNIRDFMSIAKQLGNEELFATIEDNLNKSKRSIDTLFEDIFQTMDFSNKRLKTSDDREVSKWKAIESEDKSLDESLDSNRLNESNEDVTINEEVDNKMNQNSEQQIVLKEKPITTQCIGFIPSDDSGDSLIIDEEKSSYNKSVRSLSADKNKGEKKSCPPIPIDYTKLAHMTTFNPHVVLNVLSAERKKAGLAKARANDLQKSKSLRSRSLSKSNDSTPFADNSLKKYQYERMFTHNSIKSSTQVWKSYFVPQIKTEYKELVAVVGGPHVNWFNLKIGLEINGKLQPNHVFESPELKDLRSMAVTVINNSITYAIGSEGCLFVFKHPDQKKVEIYDTIDGFIAKDETVMDITFHINSESNYLFCGTSDMKIFIFELLFDESGALNRDHFSPKLVYSCNFIVTSIVYVNKYDALVVCGESSDVIILKDITKSQKAIAGKLTPNKNFTSISSVVYIPELDLIGFRFVKSNYIQMALMDKIMSKFPLKPNFNKAIALIFYSAAKLEHTNCQIDSDSKQYLILSYNCSLICCGDDSGNVFVYGADSSLKDKNQIIKPIQVIRIPLNSQPPNKLPLIIRSVSISDDSKYLVGTTNQNIICVYYKPSDD